MKNLKLFLALFLSLAFFTACNKDDDEVLLQEENYLIFGHYFPLCEGETCIEIFRLDENSLMEDTNDNHLSNGEFYEGNFVALSEEKFQLISGFENQFPQALLDETETILGSPNVADGGALYVEYNEGGVRKFWVIDLVTENIPQVYHDFVNSTLAKIQQINE